MVLRVAPVVRDVINLSGLACDGLVKSRVPGAGAVPAPFETPVSETHCRILR